MFLYEGKVSLLFYAIINQLDILIESNGIDITMCYKNVFNLCFNVSVTKLKTLCNIYKQSLIKYVVKYKLHFSTS